MSELSVVSQIVGRNKDPAFQRIRDQAEFFSCTASDDGIIIRPLSGSDSCHAKGCANNSTYLSYADLSDVGLSADAGSVQSVVCFLANDSTIEFNVMALSASCSREAACCNWATDVLTHFLIGVKSVEKDQAPRIAAEAISSTCRYVKRETTKKAWHFFVVIAATLFVAMTLLSSQ